MNHERFFDERASFSLCDKFLCSVKLLCNTVDVWADPFPFAMPRYLSQDAGSRGLKKKKKNRNDKGFSITWVQKSHETTCKVRWAIKRQSSRANTWTNLIWIAQRVVFFLLLAAKPCIVRGWNKFHFCSCACKNTELPDQQNPQFS